MAKLSGINVHNLTASFRNILISELIGKDEIGRTRLLDKLQNVERAMIVIDTIVAKLREPSLP